jgi:hypothetical protein
MPRSLLIALVLWALPLLAQAAVVDATDAEALYQAGDYKAARTAFVALLGEFSTASKDSDDYRSYRELAYLYDRIKRGIGLVLLDTDGQGNTGEGAVRQYQQLAAATTGVIEVEDGMLRLNIARLEQNLDAFDEVRAALEQLADIEALWEKYPPPGAVQEEPNAAEE